MYFLKLSPGPVPKEDFERRLLHGDLSDAALEQLLTLAQEVFLPLLCNPKNQAGWPEVVKREVVDNMYKFSSSATVTMGLTKGQTVLPVPPVSVRPDEAPSRGSDGSAWSDSRSGIAPGRLATGGAAAAAAVQRDVDLVHVMEAAVVTWTRQIKGVMRTEPDQACALCGLARSL